MNENLDKQEVLRGSQAKEILDNPIYQETFQALKKGVIDNIIAAPIKDDDYIVRLKITLELLNQIEKAFTKVFETGENAKIKLTDDTWKKRHIVI